MSVISYISGYNNDILLDLILRGELSFNSSHV